MGQKPKAGSPKKQAGPEDKAQFERFIETARAVEADETGASFEKTFKKIVPPKRRLANPKPS